ncbi:cytochrome P450 [Actinocorallia herbida]|uniref:Cytochrome P450 n=1 Tax=Actinocorallia herbida TaxID=58109 RepID=A0A3N1DAF1_9ACTN|nr:cytochrome P450 [Actinocorallia herbida]ROO90497.1 cytochrome P450 [Actinocorallia herbida]
MKGFPDGHYTDGHPAGFYAELYGRGPVRHPELPLWLVGGHADVLKAVTDPVSFRNRDGILLEELGVTYERPPTLLHTDPPEHTRYRRLVAPAFRSSVLRGLEDDIRTRVGSLLDAGPTEFVGQFAVPLPLQVICLLLGIPEDDWERFYAWSEAFVPGASELPTEERDSLRMECGLYLVQQAHARRADPGGDVISQLAVLELDGESLTDAELVMFLIQLFVAGNETTRHALSGGLLALADDPAQWALLREDPALIPGAVEEILRWTSPVVYFLRTATADVELGGARIASGDKLMLLYGAANRDPAAFGPTAGAFDVTRASEALNLAFGFGPHFCLGAALARLELRLALTELTTRYRALERTGPARYNGSSVVAGLRSLPLTLVP